MTIMMSSLKNGHSPVDIARQGDQGLDRCPELKRSGLALGRSVGAIKFGIDLVATNQDIQ